MVQQSEPVERPHHQRVLPCRPVMRHPKCTIILARHLQRRVAGEPARAGLQAPDVVEIGVVLTIARAGKCPPAPQCGLDLLTRKRPPGARKRPRSSRRHDRSVSGDQAAGARGVWHWHLAMQYRCRRLRERGADGNDRARGHRTTHQQLPTAGHGCARRCHVTVTILRLRSGIRCSSIPRTIRHIATIRTRLIVPGPLPATFHRNIRENNPLC